MEKPSDFLLYPLRGSTALLAVGSRVLVCLHPPNLPEREAHLGFEPSRHKKKRRTLVLLFCTPSGCFGNALCARTARFSHSGLVVVEQKCRIAKPVRKRNDFQVQI